MTKDLIEAHKNCKKLMPLLHLPVQSGSNKILKNMNRKHSIEEYLEIVNILKDKNPKIKFASDFIIAYPGEKENDFEKTCKLMKKVRFINSYSYIFSPRPGTPASELEMIDVKLAKKKIKKFFKNYLKKLLLNSYKTTFKSNCESFI